MVDPSCCDAPAAVLPAAKHRRRCPRLEPAVTGAEKPSSDGANLLGLRALLALRDLELDALVLVEAAEAAGGDRRVVNENVRAAAVLGDESEALLGVEPLHGALSHLALLLLCPPDRGRGSGSVATSCRVRPEDPENERRPLSDFAASKKRA